jgi:hypothetical protein
VLLRINRKYKQKMRRSKAPLKISFHIVIPAQGVQRHVTLKHDLTLTVDRTGEIPAFAGMTDADQSSPAGFDWSWI